jgi:lipid II:glycine glycyltransferase (peptidoglycan interpeptide bridge formation enzyme)
MTHPLQTKEWGEFREEWGNKVSYYNNGLIIFSKIPHTRLTIGTVIKGSDPTKKDVEEILKIAKVNNAIFVKLEPNVLHREDLEKKFISWGLVKGKTLFTPTSFWIDLTLSEEELFKSFSSKTRYNIRLAQKHGVVIKEDNSDKAFEKYLELTFETAKRQGFYAHTPKYHRLMWKHLKEKIAHLITATYKGEIISAWILFSNDGFLYYPYGASTDIYKEVMANNLMMWEAIKLGKKLGLTTFDLWGREEGKGFTKFKEGYNPKVVGFIGSWDLVINKQLYAIYKNLEEIRWFVLRFKKKITRSTF